MNFESKMVTQAVEKSDGIGESQACCRARPDGTRT